MKYPVILFVGSAGSGKDTAAAIVARELNGVVLSLADEIKRFALNLGFSEDQLWGPSENRNAVDTRFCDKRVIQEIENELEQDTPKWLQSLPFESYFQAKNTLEHVCQELLDKAVDDGGLTPRLALQKIGTQWGRELQRDIWVDHALANAAKLLGGSLNYSRRYGITTSGKNYDTVIIPDGRFRSEVMAVKKQGGLVIRIINPDDTPKDIGGVPGHVSETEQAQIPGWHFDYTVVNDKSQGLEALEASLGVIVADIMAVEPLGGRSRGNVFDLVKHGR